MLRQARPLLRVFKRSRGRGGGEVAHVDVACECEQQHVVILVRNKGLSQLDEYVVFLVRNKE